MSKYKWWKHKIKSCSTGIMTYSFDPTEELVGTVTSAATFTIPCISNVIATASDIPKNYNIILDADNNEWHLRFNGSYNNNNMTTYRSAND